MNDEKTEGTQSTGGAELPRALVLDYFGVTNSPTAVRIRTCWMLRIFGVLYLMPAMGHVLFWAWLIIADSGSFGIENLVYFALYVLEGGCIFFLPMMFAVSGGITLLVCAGPVRKGNRFACRWCMAMIAPVMCLALLVGALIGALSLMAGLGVLASGRGEPIYLLWLLVTAGLGVLGLVHWDVIGYLRWIVRNPQVEKPAVAFLPGRAE